MPNHLAGRLPIGWRDGISRESIPVMKTNTSRFLLLLFVAVLSHGCSTSRQRTMSSAEDRRITDDRSTWVDPIPRLR